MSEQQYLSVAAYAERYVVCKKTVYRGIWKGDIPAEKIVGQWRIRIRPSQDATSSEPIDEQPIDPKVGTQPGDEHDAASSLGETQSRKPIPGPKPKWLKGHHQQ